MRLHNIKKSYEIKNYNDRNVDSYMQFFAKNKFKYLPNHSLTTYLK